MSQWWKNAIGYQIYPRSFKDSNGDGIGDLQGIIAKLPYLASLGIDFIWLNPIYASPNFDNGYDISDYYAIQPEFGTMADFKELLEKAHAKKIRIIMDLVVNHTSDQHPWFLEAVKGKENPYHDYYLWENATKEMLPNNWQSFFGGSTWTYQETSEQAYFHVFAPQQPDLNWKNPRLRKEIETMIRWWLDLGIDGFRLDAISHIQKEPWNFQITDNPWAPFMNVVGIDDYMTELKEIFADYPIMTVGEASGVSSKAAVNWTNEAGFLDMIFELEHNVRTGAIGAEKTDLFAMKKVLFRWQNDLDQDGWNALYMENHDSPRIVSTLGDGSAKSAKAIATMYLLLKGTPFIYQGQELGMTNFPFTEIEQVDAKDTQHYYDSLLAQGSDADEALKIAIDWTRDHARTPMQWTNAASGGFSEGRPWLTVNENTQTINVASETVAPDSVLNYYRDLIQLRKKNDIFVTGHFEGLAVDSHQVVAYLRSSGEKQVLVVANLTDRPAQIKLPKRIASQKWQLLLSNENSIFVRRKLKLSPFAAAVFSNQV